MFGGRPTFHKNLTDVLVQNVAPIFDENFLFDLFAQYGSILRVIVLKDPREQQTNLAVVQFHQEDSAQKALFLNNFKLDTKNISVRILPSIRDPSPKIFGDTFLIRNISPHTTAQSLQSSLEWICPIDTISLAQDRSGNSLGIGVIRFKLKEGGQTVDINQFSDGNPLRADPLPLVSENDQAVKNEETAFSVKKPVVKSNAQVMLDKMLISKRFADVTFEVQGEEISAHKLVIAERSKYFDELFSSPEPSSQPDMAKITVPDVSPIVFKAMLEYMYNNEINADEDLALELLQLDQKYQVANLRSKCEEILSSLLNVENFAKTAKIAEQHQLMSLRNSLLEFALRNNKDVMNKRILNELPKSMLIELVPKISLALGNIARFGTANPLGVFVGGLSWQTTEASLRRHFEECGAITAVKIARDNTGAPKGFGTISFASSEAANKAMGLSGSELDGTKISLTFSSG